MKFSITGMTCDGCVRSVQNVIQRIPGVKKAEVSLKDQEADVTMEAGVKPEDVIQAVQSAGYGAQPQRES